MASESGGCPPKEEEPGEEKAEACCEPSKEETSSESCCAPVSSPPPLEKEEQKSSCCTPTTDDEGDSCCSSDQSETSSSNEIIEQVDSEWSFSDNWGAFKCRVSGFRNSYAIKPGLYAIGEPDGDSDVMVSANYKLSFDHLRRAIKGMNAWILVLDTKGINVWCAAGKGTFGTAELVKRVKETDIKTRLNHRRLIVPQLGAVGVAAHEVRKGTGLKVHYGPVFARDIKTYIKAGYKADKVMRKITFGWFDRLVLAPMEMRPAMKHFLWYAAFIMVFFGLGPKGIDFSAALSSGIPFVFTGLVSLLAGSLITPVMLPYIPFKSFAIKGWIAGMATVIICINLMGDIALPLMIFSLLFFPLVSSYLALQFTGSTTYTNMSGVNKELRLSLPIYKWGGILSILLLITFKISQWGLI